MWDNATVGLELNKPVSKPACVKNSNDIIHSGSGHITHFWMEMGKDIDRNLNECQWQIWLEAIDQEIEEMKHAMNDKLNRLVGSPVLKRPRSKIKALEKRKSQSSNKLLVLMLEEEA